MPELMNIMMMEPAIPAAVVIFLAFFAEAFFGFGGGLLSVPLLSLFLGVKDAVTIVLIFQAGMGLVLLHSYKNIDWRSAGPMAIGLVIGALTGTFTLALLPDAVLKILLALSILIFLITRFLRRGMVSAQPSKIMPLLSGGIGGWFQGVIGTGGPVFTMYLITATDSNRSFRATLIAVLFITSITRLIASYPLGMFNTNVMSISTPIVPIFLIAIVAGSVVHTKVNEKYFRLCAYGVLFLSAVSLIGAAVF